MIRRILPWTLVLVASVAVPQSNAGAQATAPDSSMIAQGRKLFESKGLCFTCHGKGGEGLLGPTTRLAGRAFTHSRGTADELVTLIKAGVDAEKSVSGQVMPPRGGSRLTDREVELVAAYVRMLNGTPKNK